MHAMKTLAALLLAFLFTLAASAAEPWLKAGDVVALVGGEDMVALAEEGWLETLVTWAQPGDRIRWRSLAWEGDTVFEQRRDLNYPALETQLDRMGATVVICQFGKMESFAGKEGVAAFTEAYGKLLARLSGEKDWRFVLDGKHDPNPRSYSFDFPRLVKEWSWEGGSFALSGGHIDYEQDHRSGEKKRRIALVLPPRFGPLEDEPTSLVLPDFKPRNAVLAVYLDAIRKLAAQHGTRVLDPDCLLDDKTYLRPTRDGVHLVLTVFIHATDLGQSASAYALASALVDLPLPTKSYPYFGISLKQIDLNTAIQAKNRLWFHYTRPQNWAFLAGNRTNQPSSRDHLDPTKRWFPEEMEQWVPLIEAKEKEIWALAAAPR